MLLTTESRVATHTADGRHIGHRIMNTDAGSLSSWHTKGGTMKRTLVIASDMDAAEMKQQRRAFEAAADSGGDVIIDMSAVEFLDSSGVGAIVFLFKRLTAAGKSLCIRGAKGQPLQLLTFLRLNELLAHS